MEPVFTNHRTCRRRKWRVAFSLVELLIVILLIGALVAMLLPTIAGARSQANLLQCLSNERQLCQALIAYASENRGKFPPNISSPDPGQYWSDVDRIGMLYNVNSSTEANGQMIGPLFTCPEDLDSVRTYAMNIWASSKVIPSVLKPSSGAQPLGSLWALNVACPSSMILIGETWSSSVYSANSFLCKTTFGNEGPGTSIGQRFGGGGGIPPFNAGRWGEVNCELPYMLHRVPRAAGRGTQPIGRVNLGYADGHAESKSNQDLVNFATGVSTNESFFSPLDYHGP